ncbi:MAG: hypothetical protein H6Q90_429 [Deltaproteobacteria bacterium]|nr:hypothetical protein [Deltaproteobacteria bacterium]
MAAVFALVFVPALAATLCIMGMFQGGVSFGSALAAAVFLALSTGMVTGLFRLAHKWEDEEPT